MKREWNEFKHGVVVDVINSKGIRPGYGKWSKWWQMTKKTMNVVFTKEHSRYVIILSQKYWIWKVLNFIMSVLVNGDDLDFNTHQLLPKWQCRSWLKTWSHVPWMKRVKVCIPSGPIQHWWFILMNMLNHLVYEVRSLMD